MHAKGTEGFFSAYRSVFEARMPFGTFLIMRFDPDQPPVLLDHWLAAEKIRNSALGEYLENTYAFDPFYQFRNLPEDGGVYRLAEIVPDRFFFSEYYLQYYRRAGLCDEIGLLAPMPSGATAHLSLSRLDRQGPFRRREIRFIRHFAPLLLELLVEHCSLVSPVPSKDAVATVPPLSELIRAQAIDGHSIAVTRREAQIAALVLQGHSNGSAALVLDIATETCKVHRRNLYRKLGISSQRDLFGLFKHLL